VIVCLCKAVSDGRVRAARDAGARTVEAIGASTGAGTCCGCCRPAIARILAESPGGTHPCVASAPAAAEGVPVRAAADRLKAP
jgi:bacterioferritin-associated ferredoxin